MGKLAGRRVLVVEDEPLIAMTMQDIIADLGGSCAVAATVGGALALITSDAFDVAVLDLNLRGETSRPVALQLRARDVPFVYATGYGDAAADADGAPIIAKPYSQEDVAEALMRLLSA